MTARTHPGSKDGGSRPSSGSDSESVADQLAVHVNQRIQRRRLRQQVRSLVQAGAYADAIAFLDELLAHEPAAQDFNNRGYLLARLGHHEAAIADYSAALALNPNLDAAYHNRANSYAAVGDADASLADYDRAIDLNPLNLRSRLNQSILYRQMQRYGQARELLEESLWLALNVLDPYQVPHLAGLVAHLYAEQGRIHHLLGSWNAAIADYQRSLHHLPTMPNPRSEQAQLRAQVSDWLTTLINPLSA